jgi:outer membrane protein OmpA-like peptidoglycan-associated protein
MILETERMNTELVVMFLENVNNRCWQEKKLMTNHTRLATNAIVLAGACAALLTTQGCIATRDWVKTQMQPVTQQVATYDERLTRAELRLNGIEGTLRVVDAKSEQALHALANLKIERRVVIDVKEGATFGFGSANLPKQAKKEIDAVLKELKAEASGMDATTIVVAGHTDNAGSPEYNYDLGQQRAKAVAQYVTSKTATDPLQVIPVSYGESAPLSTNTTANGRAKNRRVEILVYRDVVASSSPTAPAAADKEPGETPQPALPAQLSQSR